MARAFSISSSAQPSQRSTNQNKHQHQVERNALSTHPHRRWDGGDGVVCPVLRVRGSEIHSHPYLCSTITYDTLVRSGVRVVSAFVPDLSQQASATGGNTVIARCSRGMGIVPDTHFDLSHCGPVSAGRILHWVFTSVHVNFDMYDGRYRTNTTY